MITDDRGPKRINPRPAARRPWRYQVGLALLATSLTAVAADSLDFSVGVAAPVNTPEAVVDTALTQLCPSVPGETSLAAVCGYLKGVTAPLPDQKSLVDEVLREISAKVNTSPTLVVSRAPAIRFSGDIASRLAALRRGMQTGPLSSGFRLSGRRGNPSTPIFRANANPESAGGLYSQRLSGFINGNFTSAKQSETPTEMGYDSTGQGLTAGIDYRFGLRTFMGIAPQLNNIAAELDDQGSELKASQYAVILYGSHFLSDAWYVEGTLGRGAQNLKLSRHIAFTAATPVDLTALGDTQSAQTSFSIGSGSELLLPQNATLSLMANLVYANSVIDGYTEQNAGTLNLTIGEQDVSSITTQLTASVSRAFSFKFGVLIPQLGATWLHELSSEGERLKAQFAADANATQFGFVTQNQDSDYYIINADIQFLVPGGRVGFVRLSNVRLLRDRSEAGITAGYRMEF